MHSIASHLRSVWGKWRGRDRVEAEADKALQPIRYHYSDGTVCIIRSDPDGAAVAEWVGTPMPDRPAVDPEPLSRLPGQSAWAIPLGQSTWVRYDREHGVWKPDPRSGPTPTGGCGAGTPVEYIAIPSGARASSDVARAARLALRSISEVQGRAGEA
jgi:hypothetical protein